MSTQTRQNIWALIKEATSPHKTYREKAWRQLYKKAASCTSPGSNTPQNSSCTVTSHPSRKLSKLDEPDMRDTAGEVKTNSWAIYSCGRAKVGRPARIYIQQLCADTGCTLEDLPGAIDDRDGWRERASSVTWWWWWWWQVHNSLLNLVILTFYLLIVGKTSVNKIRQYPFSAKWNLYCILTIHKSRRIHRLHLCRGVRSLHHECPVGWGYRIHWLQRGKTPPQWVC